MKRILVFIIIVGLFCVFTPNLEAASVKIGIADDEARKPNYKHLVNHLNQSGLGTFEFVFYETVEGLHVAFSSGQVRLALFGPVYYAKVHAETGAVPVVKDKPNASVIFVRSDSEIKDLEGLRGHKFAFGYYESTTSSMIPRMTLWRELGRNVLVASEAGIINDHDRIYFEQLGSHAAVVDAVASGQFDAGATVDVLFERNKHRGLRAIYTSDPYPGVPLVCHKDEDPIFLDQLRKAFLSYHSPDNAPYHHFKTGATAASDDEYGVVRYLCSVALHRDYE